jgi:hypothetical protein
MWSQMTWLASEKKFCRLGLHVRKTQTDIRVTTKGGHVSVPATGVTTEALKPDVLT